MFEPAAVDGPARAGVVTTARGRFETPCFMPVGTRGAVKLLDSSDLDALGPQVVLANTYHLMLRPGADVVAEHGGLHRFTGWSGHMLPIQAGSRSSRSARRWTTTESPSAPPMTARATG
jgi:queuine tRNA-ribosyltransferase